MFEFENAELRVDRTNADGWSEGVSRSVMYLKGKKGLDVHVFSDQSSLEIFTDQYRNNHSNNVFAPSEQNLLSIRAYGGTAVIKDIMTCGLKDACHS